MFADCGPKQNRNDVAEGQSEVFSLFLNSMLGVERWAFAVQILVMSYLRLFIPLICIFTFVRSSPAQEPKPDKPKQFIYVLRLVPRLHSDVAWTKDDKAALARHLTRFKHAIETGELILAGRTLESGDKTFGIAVFEASDEAAARKFMESDPAVVAGLMTAELHPFAVALQRKNP
jgi:uncharacterized protein YciI